jgi:hypothetical protein
MCSKVGRDPVIAYDGMCDGEGCDDNIYPIFAE